MLGQILSLDLLEVSVGVQNNWHHDDLLPYCCCVSVGLTFSLKYWLCGTNRFYRFRLETIVFFFHFLQCTGIIFQSCRLSDIFSESIRFKFIFICSFRLNILWSCLVKMNSLTLPLWDSRGSWKWSLLAGTRSILSLKQPWHWCDEVLKNTPGQRPFDVSVSNKGVTKRS